VEIKLEDSVINANLPEIVKPIYCYTLCSSVQYPTYSTSLMLHGRGLKFICQKLDLALIDEVASVFVSQDLGSERNLDKILYLEAPGA